MTNTMDQFNSYTLMIGLNDKDTKTQQISTLDAYKVVANLMQMDCTITEGKGVYTHKNGQITFETSLVVEVIDFEGTLEMATLLDRVEQIKVALNQESVAIKRNVITSGLF